MVQPERVAPQDLESVEVLTALLVRDGRDRGVQPRDVGLHGDRQAVAEAAAEPVEDDLQPPQQGRRDGQPDAGDRHVRAGAVVDAVDEQREPEADQGRRAARARGSWRPTRRAAGAPRGRRA